MTRRKGDFTRSGLNLGIKKGPLDGAPATYRGTGLAWCQVGGKKRPRASGAVNLVWLLASSEVHRRSDDGLAPGLAPMHSFMNSIRPAWPGTRP
jgi:hypothetical protein